MRRRWRGRGPALSWGVPPRPPTLTAQLSRAPLLAALDAEALARLAAAARVRRYARGQLLWQQGQRQDQAAVVLLGRLDVCRVTADGERMLLRVLGPGEVVGLSVVAGEAHSADLVAGDALQVALLPGAALRQLFASRPALALAAMARLGDLLRQLTDEMEDLRFADLQQRLRSCLARLGRGRREVRLTHAELAEQVGASRANVSRALKRLERGGLLRCRRGRVELLGP